MNRLNLPIAIALTSVLIATGCKRRDLSTIAVNNMDSTEFTTYLKQSVVAIDTFGFAGNDNYETLERKAGQWKTIVEVCNHIMRFDDKQGWVYRYKGQQYQDDALNFKARFFDMQSKVEPGMRNNYAIELAYYYTKQIGYDIKGLALKDEMHNQSNNLSKVLTLASTCFVDTNICNKLYTEKAPLFKTFGYTTVVFAHHYFTNGSYYMKGPNDYVKEIN